MGVGLGAAFPAGYSALTEFTPPQKRGKYQSYVGLIANCGTLFASVMNLIILPIAGWREVFVFCGVLGAVAVSYTHLDVYKRQDLSSLKSALKNGACWLMRFFSSTSDSCSFSTTR